MPKLARRGDMTLRDALRAIIEEFQPSLIVSPSMFDLHADHRAIAYYAHTAAPEATIATYIVHGSGPANRLAGQIELTESEQRRKREAIECHVSQLALSRDRFLSYARTTESFYRAEFDVVRVESAARQWMTAFRHSMRVLFGVYPTADSGVQPAADVQDSTGDVPGLL
jgi:LmbE family N-acetylglucosaminyl deacetylase